MADVPSTSIVVGQLAGVFGVKGWVKVRSFTQPEKNILEYNPWRIKTATGIKTLEVDAYNLRPQGLVVHFKGIDDRDIAAQFGRAEIEVDAAELPELPAGDYYWHQLIGLKVITEEGAPQILGVVSEMLETGANDVLVVRPSPDSIDARERLVPYVPDLYVRKVDLDARAIYVMWDPEF
ncbi:ribosome maturation factor RimM [Saccharophagus sp. K07]|jgi:16S rRNA processing protein RimM|uniref:ribosome maturation factor RimM n=1 Tax=Saccharophagus sp. K07 TaxID=2283636 RepID=UPI001651B383|nr:ribosome maturation factor RimM [Saccharophagus sp. K07]MBC6903863.1 ribosome maturation factor RimM [Saccharophagus sp. K07]